MILCHLVDLIRKGVRWYYFGSCPHVAIISSCFPRFRQQGLGVLWLMTGMVASVAIEVNAWNTIEEDYQGDDTLGNLPYWTFIINGIITAILIYPHIVLILEIKAGIMTPDTFYREQYSCCCV